MTLIAAGVSKPNADRSIARDEWIAAKNTYARQKTNNKIITKVWDPDGMVDPIEGVSETNGDFATWLKNELKHGEDVELAYYWLEGAHIVTVLEVYTSGGETYVKYRDDEKQGDNTKGDTHVKHSKVYKKEGKWHFGSDSNTIYFAVSESADKNQNGIGDGFDAAAKQGMIIDGFSGDGLLAVVNQDSVFPVKNGMTIPDQMLGGELEFVLNLQNTAAPGDGMSAEIKDGSLNLMMDSSCTGQAVLTWDGKGDSWDSINATSGLGGIDITQGGTQNGIEVSILNNVSPTDLSLVLFSTVDDSSEMTQTIAQTTSPITVTFPLEHFVPNGNGADWRSIQAIAAILDMTGPADIKMDSFQTGYILQPPPMPPTEIKIDFEAWLVGTLFDKDSFLQFNPELQDYVEINTEGPPWEVEDTGDGKVLEAGAGRIDDDESQSFTISLTSGGGTGSCVARTDCEEGYDIFTVSVNGDEKCSFSGQTDRGHCEFDIPPGPCTVKFEYSKDGSVSEGQDNAQVDDIDIVADELQPIVVIAFRKGSQVKTWIFARETPGRMGPGLFIGELRPRMLDNGLETLFLRGTPLGPQLVSPVGWAPLF